MRRATLVLALAISVLVSSPQAGGHPGHGPGEVSVGDNRFLPRSLTVATGDTVIWFWNGPDTNHSVTSDPGQDETFDSDRGETPALVRHKVNDAYSHVFQRIGTYAYHCKVHPAMHGTIEVIKPPPKDVTRPRLTHLRVSPRRASSEARARFTISEASFVVVSIRRAGSSKEVRSASAFVRRGKRAVRFGVRRLRPGPYRARVVAEDNAANRSRPQTARFRVVRA